MIWVGRRGRDRARVGLRGHWSIVAECYRSKPRARGGVESKLRGLSLSWVLITGEVLVEAAGGVTKCGQGRAL